MRIAIHAFDGITMFHLAAPLLVFGEVDRLGLAEGWTPTVWTDDGGPVRTAEGLLVDAVAGPSVVDDADLLVFPSWPTDLATADERMTERMHAAHSRGSQVVGLCLGAFPVVDSGLLDGRTAVTHWDAAAELAGRRPGVVVDAAALYLDHGDVLTSAGTASAIDACLHLVREHLGASAAATLARHLVVAPHREGGQAQYVARPMPQSGEVAHLGSTLEWALTHLEQPLTVGRLADHAGMSRRHFTRRFAEVTGTTPARWLLARRLDEARELLETTRLTIAAVARACGFGSAVTFRQNFIAAFGTSPTSYRQRFSLDA
jgi:transcriptional regulator GlxA family with amidase domain